MVAIIHTIYKHKAHPHKEAFVMNDVGLTQAHPTTLYQLKIGSAIFYLLHFLLPYLFLADLFGILMLPI